MEPVYTASIIIASGDDFDAIKFNNFLARILCTPILQQSCYLPGVFMPLRPNVTSCDLSMLRIKLPQRDDDEQMCLEWCAQYSAKKEKVTLECEARNDSRKIGSTNQPEKRLCYQTRHMCITLM